MLRLIRVLTTCAVVCWAGGVLASNSGLVSASGKRFMLNGKPYFYGGCNCYYLMVFAADAGLRSHVDEVLEEAHAMGLSVVRTWAFNDGASEWNALQTAPGVYQEYVFVGLDYVLNKADTLGIRLILPLVNNWDDYGGMNQYVAWAGAGSHDDFYTNTDCKNYYKNHVATVLNRMNTINGRTYKNDPTVFAWELANEPRAETAGVAVLNAWVDEMSQYIKSIDANHMVCAGIEGFYSTGVNPKSWMQSMGTDFITTQQFGTIDFAVAHSWPDHWGTTQAATMNFVQQQISDAHDTLRKPFVLEEFGKHQPLVERDDWYEHFLDQVYDNRGGGWNFWILYHDEYPDYDEFGVYYPAHASTVSIIESHAAAMTALIPQETVTALGALRSVAVGQTVWTSEEKVVTAASGGQFYVEDDDRCAAVRVGSTAVVNRGDRIRTCGTLSTGDFDMYLDALYVDVVSTPGDEPGPLGLTTRSLCGAPPDGWPGPTDAVGAYNVALLVRVAGCVIPDDGFFYLDDGSGELVKVYGSVPGSSFAAVTGIAGYEAGWQKVVTPRDASDIQAF